MDVNTHVRAIWRHRLLLLTGAAAVGLVVLLLRLTATASYTTSAALYLLPGNESETTVARLGEVYAQLDDNPLILRATAGELPGVTTESIRRSTEITALSDGLMQVTAVADSAERSAQLANTFSAALSQAVELDQQRTQALALQPVDAQLAAVEEQLAGLTEGDAGFRTLQEQRSALSSSRASLLARSLPRLDLLASAEAREAERAPQPVRDAVLAFLVTFIVLAELVVLRTVRQGRLDGMGLVESLEQLSALPVLRIGSSRDGEDGSIALLQLAIAGQSEDRPAIVKLLPLDPTSRARASTLLLADSAARAGRAVVVLSLESPPAPVAAAAEHRGVRTLRPTTSALARQAREGKLAATAPGEVVLLTVDAWEAPETLAAAPLSGTTVLVVDARVVRAPAVQEALKVLALAGTPADLVVLADLDRRRARDLLRHDCPAGPPAAASAGAATGATKKRPATTPAKGGRSQPSRSDRS